ARTGGIRRADDAVANHRVRLHDAAELGHARVDREHAGRNLCRTGVDDHLGRCLYTDTACFQLDRVAVAVGNLDRTWSVFQDDLLPGGRLEYQGLTAVGIIERDLDAVARTDHLAIVLAGAVHGIRRRVLTVP